MSKVQFSSNNKVGQEIVFQTYWNTGLTHTTGFGPNIAMNGTKRVHWDFGTGDSYFAGNSPSFYYTDTGDTKTVKIKTQKLSDINSFSSVRDRIIGVLDLSGLTLGGVFKINNSPDLSGLTHSYSDSIFTEYQIRNQFTGGLRGSSITSLDLSMFPNLGGVFRVENAYELTGVTHTGSTQLFTNYYINGCNIIGNHDISMLTNLSGVIDFTNNNLLTAITRSFTTNNIDRYEGQNCNLLGNHDMTLYPNLGEFFRLNSNNNLTGVTHTATTRNFFEYNLGGCNILDNHDLSMIPNIGGRFNMNSNTNLTGITHSVTPNTQLFKATLGGGYFVSNCNITGVHDISNFLNFGSDVPNIFTTSQECRFDMSNNPNLINVVFVSTGTTNYISRFHLYDCDITGHYDLSIFPNLYGSINFNTNPNLTGVTLPNSVGHFRDISTGLTNASTAIGFVNCNIPYIDFRPLSGATMLTNSAQGCRIRFQENNMTSGNINRILSEFSGITYNNLTGWSGVTAFIGGTNSPPDSSSGGYDGLAAISYLTGATPTGGGWTINI
jgi:hypothetical protein